MKRDCSFVDRPLSEGVPLGTDRQVGLKADLPTLFRVVTMSLCLCGSGFAAPADPGRLFYTPAQRAQLENARAHHVVAPVGRSAGAAVEGTTADAIPAPQTFDGIVTRSDGAATRWVDGKAQRSTAGVAGLKPGQIRARGKVYEPYQVLRPSPTDKDSAP